MCFVCGKKKFLFSRLMNRFQVGYRIKLGPFSPDLTVLRLNCMEVVLFRKNMRRLSGCSFCSFPFLLFLSLLFRVSSKLLTKIFQTLNYCFIILFFFLPHSHFFLKPNCINSNTELKVEGVPQFHSHLFVYSNI